MKRLAVSVAALLLTLSLAQPAVAQSGCRPGFINPQRFFPVNEAKPSDTPLRFAAGEPLGDVSYRVLGSAITGTLDEYLGKFCTTGFLVLHRNRIVFERYLQGVQPQDSLLSASMSKTILSLLVGVAIAEGKLALDERVGSVLPDFAGSAFADDTIDDLLRMTSRAALKTSYVPGEASDNQATDPMISPRRNMRSYLRGKTELTGPARQFHYNGAVSALLGLVLRERTGTSNTQYLAERLWSAMGAEGTGYWIRNQNGEEGVQGQFVATLRDYARLGFLVMNQGAVDGRQIVPADWITGMATLRKDKPQPPHAPFYGLHVWLPQAGGGRMFFWGAAGQNIFVDPVAKVVIVHTGNSPAAGFDGAAHLFPLRDAIVKKLSARPG
jgi:CubicO group peptidase (beta-lactamase class C family)